MKALSGREHEVLVKVEGQDYLLTEEEYNGLANNRRLKKQKSGSAKMQRQGTLPTMEIGR